MKQQMINSLNLNFLTMYLIKKKWFTSKNNPVWTNFVNSKMLAMIVAKSALGYNF